MEWMDPMSWRLPSGKALAEFALQSGFLAPLLLKPKVKARPPEPGQRGREGARFIEGGMKEAPESPASFREVR
jgi:hypothetical protein